MLKASDRPSVRFGFEIEVAHCCEICFRIKVFSVIARICFCFRNMSFLRRLSVLSGMLHSVGEDLQEIVFCVTTYGVAFVKFALLAAGAT
jgi:hypothetical protein